MFITQLFVNHHANEVKCSVQRQQILYSNENKNLQPHITMEMNLTNGLFKENIQIQKSIS